MKKLIITALMLFTVGTVNAKDIGNGWDLSTDSAYGINFVALQKETASGGLLSFMWDDFTKGVAMSFENNNKNDDPIIWFIKAATVSADGTETLLSQSDDCFAVQRDSSIDIEKCTEDGYIMMDLTGADTWPIMKDSVLLLQYQSKESAAKNQYWTNRISLKGSNNAIKKFAALAQQVAVQ